MYNVEVLMYNNIHQNIASHHPSNAADTTPPRRVCSVRAVTDGPHTCLRDIRTSVWSATTSETCPSQVGPPGGFSIFAALRGFLRPGASRLQLLDLPLRSGLSLSQASAQEPRDGHPGPRAAPILEMIPN